MTKRPSVPCEGCGKLMWTGGRKAYLSSTHMCRQCRVEKHVPMNFARPPLIPGRTRTLTPRPWLHYVPDKVIGPLFQSLLAADFAEEYRRGCEEYVNGGTDG